MKIGGFQLSVAAFAATGRKNVLPGDGRQGRALRAAKRSKILDSLRPAQIHSAAAAIAAADSGKNLFSRRWPRRAAGA